MTDRLALDYVASHTFDVPIVSDSTASSRTTSISGYCHSFAYREDMLGDDVFIDLSTQSPACPPAYAGMVPVEGESAFDGNVLAADIAPTLPMDARDIRLEGVDFATAQNAIDASRRLPDDRTVRLSFRAPRRYAQAKGRFDARRPVDDAYASKTVVLRDYSWKGRPRDVQLAVHAIVSEYPTKYLRFLSDFVDVAFGDVVTRHLRQTRDALRRMLDDATDDVLVPTLMRRVQDAIASPVVDDDFADPQVFRDASLQDCVQDKIETYDRLIDLCRGVGTSPLGVRVMCEYWNMCGRHACEDMALADASDVGSSPVLDYDRVVLRVPLNFSFAKGDFVAHGSDMLNTLRLPREMDGHLAPSDADVLVDTDVVYVPMREVPVGDWMAVEDGMRWGFGHASTLLCRIADDHFFNYYTSYSVDADGMCVPQRARALALGVCNTWGESFASREKHALTAPLRTGFSYAGAGKFMETPRSGVVLRDDAAASVSKYVHDHPIHFKLNIADLSGVHYEARTDLDSMLRVERGRSSRRYVATRNLLLLGADPSAPVPVRIAFVGDQSDAATRYADVVVGRDGYAYRKVAMRDLAESHTLSSLSRKHPDLVFSVAHVLLSRNVGMHATHFCFSDCCVYPRNASGSLQPTARYMSGDRSALRDKLKAVLALYVASDDQGQSVWARATSERIHLRKPGDGELQEARDALRARLQEGHAPLLPLFMPRCYTVLSDGDGVAEQVQHLHLLEVLFSARTRRERAHLTLDLALGRAWIILYVHARARRKKGREYVVGRSEVPEEARVLYDRGLLDAQTPVLTAKGVPHRQLHAQAMWPDLEAMRTWAETLRDAQTGGHALDEVYCVYPQNDMTVDLVRAADHPVGLGSMLARRWRRVAADEDVPDVSDVPEELRRAIEREMADDDDSDVVLPDDVLRRMPDVDIRLGDVVRATDAQGAEQLLRPHVPLLRELGNIYATDGVRCVRIPRNYYFGDEGDPSSPSFAPDDQALSVLRTYVFEFMPFDDADRPAPRRTVVDGAPVPAGKGFGLQLPAAAFGGGARKHSLYDLIDDRLSPTMLQQLDLDDREASGRALAPEFVNRPDLFTPSVHNLGAYRTRPAVSTDAMNRLMSAQYTVDDQKLSIPDAQTRFGPLEDVASHCTSLGDYTNQLMRVVRGLLSHPRALETLAGDKVNARLYANIVNDVPLAARMLVELDAFLGVVSPGARERVDALRGSHLFAALDELFGLELLSDLGVRAETDDADPASDDDDDDAVYASSASAPAFFPEDGRSAFKEAYVPDARIRSAPFAPLRALYSLRTHAPLRVARDSAQAVVVRPLNPLQGALAFACFDAAARGWALRSHHSPADALRFVPHDQHGRQQADQHYWVRIVLEAFACAHEEHSDFEERMLAAPRSTFPASYLGRLCQDTAERERLPDGECRALVERARRLWVWYATTSQGWAPLSHRDSHDLLREYGVDPLGPWPLFEGVYHSRHSDARAANAMHVSPAPAHKPTMQDPPFSRCGGAPCVDDFVKRRVELSAPHADVRVLRRYGIGVMHADTDDPLDVWASRCVSSFQAYVHEHASVVSRAHRHGGATSMHVGNVVTELFARICNPRRMSAAPQMDVPVVMGATPMLHEASKTLIIVAATVGCARDLVAAAINGDPELLLRGVQAEYAAPWAVRMLEMADAACLVERDGDDLSAEERKVRFMQRKIDFLQRMNALLLLRCGADASDVVFPDEAGQKPPAVTRALSMGAIAPVLASEMDASLIIWREVAEEDAHGRHLLGAHDVGIPYRTGWVDFEAALEQGRATFDASEYARFGIGVAEVDQVRALAHSAVRTASGRTFVADRGLAAQELATQTADAIRQYDALLASDGAEQAQAMKESDDFHLARLHDPHSVDERLRPSYDDEADARSLAIATDRSAILSNGEDLDMEYDEDEEDDGEEDEEDDDSDEDDDDFEASYEDDYANRAPLSRRVARSP